MGLSSTCPTRRRKIAGVMFRAAIPVPGERASDRNEVNTEAFHG